jgi:homoserine dehydrogenase
MARAASNKNALYFNGDACGDIFITGAGAGGMPTASGVMADLMNAIVGNAGPKPISSAAPIPNLEVEVLEEVN